jgi:hypothetical protein
MKKLLLVLFCIATNSAFAYTGEMGSGVPGKIAYVGTNSGSPRIRIEFLGGVTPAIPFPGNCTFVSLSSAGLGAELFRIAGDILVRAKTMELPMRFYAFASHGAEACEADYFELR